MYLLTLVLTASAVFASASSPGYSVFEFTSAASVDVTCQQLGRVFPNAIFFPNSTSYVELNEDYFSSASWLGPACIVAPSSAADLGVTVRLLRRSGVPFAIRGGGHMPIRDAANINGIGILISSSGLRQLRMSADNSTVTVGSGLRWGAVYRYLEPYNKAVVAGRMGVVGVPGFLLGGGISFFGNEYGWASANLAAIEVVLADGRVVTATAANQYADLFWALRGGGNSFGLVASFTLRTFDAPGVTVGQVSYGVGQRDAFLDSVYGFAHNGTLDLHAAVTPTVNYMPSRYDGQPYYTGMLCYNGDDLAPAALANFTGANSGNGNGSGSGLPAPSTSTVSYRSLANWANETETGFDQVHGLRFRFHIVSIVADLDAMTAIHDTFLAQAQEKLSQVSGLLATLAFMPISKTYIETNRGSSTSGDPFGIDSSRAPYIWVEESIMYAPTEANDAVVSQFLVDANDAIHQALAAVSVSKGFDVTSAYLYLNDADADQPVFAGYDPANLARLRSIRAKYDPRGVYTHQMPGGFKVV